MLRSQLRSQSRAQAQQSAASRFQGVIVFSVAGVRFAARADEIGGVMPWPGSTAVPSDTPYVAALVRHQKDCLPVFDLAEKLRSQVSDPGPLCLVAKHVDGPMALCIDSQVPSLHLVERSAIRYQSGGDPDIAGICVAGNEEFPLLNLTTLGIAPARTN
jgi:chemotaxis signal transduction protein